MQRHARAGVARKRTAAAVIAAALVVLSLTSCAGPGPLFDEDLNPHAYVFETGPGATIFADGFETIEALPDDDVVIESIRSLGLPDGVDVLGTLLSGPLGPNGTSQSFDAFPPVDGLDGDVFEAGGAVIPAGSGYYQIIIGYRTEVDDTAVRTGVEVTYSVADARYRRILPAGIVICPPTVDDAICDEEMDSLVDRLVDEHR